MNPVGEELAPGVVLLGGVGVGVVRSALSIAVDLHRVNGRRLPEPLRMTAELFGAAGVAAVGGSPVHAHGAVAEVPQSTDRSPSYEDMVTTQEAAQMLGCGARNVRDLSERGTLASGRKTGGRLWLDKAEVQAEKNRREGARSA